MMYQKWGVFSAIRLSCEKFGNGACVACESVAHCINIFRTRVRGSFTESCIITIDLRSKCMSISPFLSGFNTCEL